MYVLGTVRTVRTVRNVRNVRTVRTVYRSYCTYYKCSYYNSMTYNTAISYCHIILLYHTVKALPPSVLRLPCGLVRTFTVRTINVL
jgi:hypothetical protein